LKYLEIIFDYKITFKEHIKNMASKFPKIIFFIFSLPKSAKLNRL